MDTGAWLAVIGGAAVAGIAIWGLVEAKHNKDDVKDLGSKIDALTASIAANNAANAAANAATQAQIKAINNAIAIANAAAQQAAQLAQIANLAVQAQAALAASGNTSQAAAAASIAAQAQASATRLASLQAQIAAQQAAIAGGGGSAQTLQNLLGQEEIERANSNKLTLDLTALLNLNRNTAGVPGSGGLTQTGSPGITSASVPV